MWSIRYKFRLCCLVLSAAVLSRVITYVPAWLNAGMAMCLRPLLAAEQAFIHQIQSWCARRQAIEELTELVASYKKRNSLLLADNIALFASRHEAEQTASLLSFSQRYQTEHMVKAQIILKYMHDEEHFVLVDAGTNRGICRDMVAVWHNCLVGRVIEVFSWYAKVVLVTDRLSKIPVVCARTKAQGIYQGTNNLDEASLEFVSHLCPLEQGDLLISSGDGLIYPKGFGVGTIESFTLDGLGLNYCVRVKPLINIHELPSCFLVQRGAEYKEPIETSNNLVTNE